MARSWLTALVAAVFPGRCPGCGGAGEPVCAECLATFRAAPPQAPPVGIDVWVAPFAYEGVARELVARAKFQGRHAAFDWLAAVMADAWRSSPRPVPDLVTWAPTAPAHRRARGFDHGRLLGCAVGAELGVLARPVLARAPGPAQTDLPVHARRAGPDLRAGRRVAGTVLVVDDVATTGATLRACAQSLRAVGATRVLALTATRTASPSSRGRDPAAHTERAGQVGTRRAST